MGKNIYLPLFRFIIYHLIAIISSFLVVRPGGPDPSFLATIGYKILIYKIIFSKTAQQIFFLIFQVSLYVYVGQFHGRLLNKVS